MNVLKLGIIAAMEPEVRSLVESLENQRTQEVANQLIYEGTIAGKEVVLIQSGIGKVNATIATTLLIERLGVTHVINTGSAGGIGTHLAVGDLVVSTQLAYHDADARAFDYAYGQVPGMPLYYPADNLLQTKVKQAAESLSWSAQAGEVLSGDSFISSQERRQAIIGHFPNALAVEMEGAAVAQCCWQFDVPFVVIRAISDLGDEEASISFDEFIEKVGKKSAELVREVIKQV